MYCHVGFGMGGVVNNFGTRYHTSDIIYSQLLDFSGVNCPSSSSSSISSSSSSSSRSSSSSSSSSSCELNDSFTGSDGTLLNSEKWDYIYETDSPVISGNKAYTKVSSASAGQLKDGVRGKLLLSGNFDVQIDYTLQIGPSADGWNGMFRVIPVSGDSFFGVTRGYAPAPSGQYYSVIEKEESVLSSPVVSASNDTGGAFKLIRQNGNEMIGQVWNGQQWVTLKQAQWVGGDVDVEFLLTTSGTQPTVVMEWDTFQVNSVDSFTCGASG